MKRALPAALLLSAAGLTYLLWPADAPGPANRASEPKASSSAHAPVKAPPEPWTDGSDEARDGCVFEKGTRLAYQLQYRAQSEITAHLLGQPGDKPIATTSRQAMRLHALVVEPTIAAPAANGAQSGADKQAAVLLARFEEVSSEGTGRIPESLGTPFLLRINHRCELEGFARHQQLPRIEARIQQAFAYELNPSWQDGEQGERTVDNSTGRALVEVSSRIRGGQRTVQQSVRGYRELWRGRNGAALDFGRAPERSELTAVMGDGPWFERFRKDELLEGAAGSASTFVQALSVALPAEALDPALYAPHDFVWEHLLPQYIETPRADAVTDLDHREQDKVRHFTPQFAAQRFIQRFESGAGIQQAWPELTHYLEARPEETNTLVSMMKRDEISTDASPAFYIALGRARTPQARDALLSIMHDEIAPVVERVRAMFGLVDREDVGVGLANEFAVMSRSISRGQNDAERVLGREAVLALGAMAGLHDDAEVMEVAVHAAGLTLSEGDDATERRPGYGALANIGDPKNLHFAEKASHSPDAREREAAAIVVRRMHPNDTSAFVAEWLARETDQYVKEALYTTVDLQTTDTPVAVGPSLVDQALRDLAHEPRVITRKAILNVLGRSGYEYRRAKQALIDQIPYELQEDTGIYDTIVRHLDPDEIRLAIANVGKEIERGR